VRGGQPPAGRPTATRIAPNTVSAETSHSLVPILRTTTFRSGRSPDPCDHKSTIVTQKVYRNSRELHQPGEKPQATRPVLARNRFRRPLARTY
jgi:hypothetical protein